MNDIRGHIRKQMTTRKGPNSSRVASRDRKLAYRFYYYAALKNLGYNVLLDNLSKEFDIAERVVLQRLKDNPITGLLFEQKPTVEEIREEYPYFNW